jgi:HAD superfamily hydrolase (TIGR01509 family)
VSVSQPRRDRAVGFDIDHTLCIDNKLERVAFLHLLERIVDDGGSPLGTLAEESERIDDLLVRARSGVQTIDEAVALFARDRGVDGGAEYAAGFRRMALAMAETFIVPDPYSREVFGALEREGFGVAILSNGWNPLQQAKARRAGFGGTVLASEELGVQKPSPKAFAALVAELGVDPKRCFYVGDDPVSDVQGALGAGLRAIWLDQEGRTYPDDLPRPTIVVHSLQDVVAAVLAEARV